MNEQRFYVCDICGNIIAKIEDSGVPVICCGEPMSNLTPTAKNPNGLDETKIIFNANETPDVYVYSGSDGLRKGEI